MLGLERLLEERDEVDEEALRLVQEREEARLRAGLRRARTRSATSCSERGWEVRDTSEGPVLVPAAGS